jgi:hypothetical protein
MKDIIYKLDMIILRVRKFIFIVGNSDKISVIIFSYIFINYFYVNSLLYISFISPTI